MVELDPSELGAVEEEAADVDEEVVDADEEVEDVDEEVAGAGEEERTVLNPLSSTPSQINAKDLNAVIPKHNPVRSIPSLVEKPPLPPICLRLKLGIGFSSVGSGVQFSVL